MNRKDFGAKPLLFPQPVLILAAYDENGVPDAMNAAWGTITDVNEITISLGAGHKTTKNLLTSGAFTVSVADEAHVAACDYLGIASGNTVPDKFARSGLTATESEKVHAPIINELAVCLECRVKRYEDEILVGEIVNVNASEEVLTDGKVDMTKVRPICFDPFSRSYFGIGEKAGDAWGAGKSLM